jgi:hypothetical protein
MPLVWFALGLLHAMVFTVLICICAACLQDEHLFARWDGSELVPWVFKRQDLVDFYGRTPATPPSLATLFKTIGAIYIPSTPNNPVTFMQNVEAWSTKYNLGQDFIKDVETAMLGKECFHCCILLP